MPRDRAAAGDRVVFDPAARRLGPGDLGRGVLRGSASESVRDTHTWDGHLVLVHSDERQRRAGVVAWVRRGLELGAKILYIEPVDEPAERALISVLKQHELNVDRAVDRGQLQVLPADELTYSTTWQAGTVDAALAEGYPTVRWSAEAETAWGVMSSDCACRHRVGDGRDVSAPPRVDPVPVLLEPEPGDPADRVRDARWPGPGVALPHPPDPGRHRARGRGRCLQRGDPAVLPGGSLWRPRGRSASSST